MDYVVVDQLSKTYQQQAVLRNLSLSLDCGEFATLLGPSGCGKSTLLRIIAGLVSADKGTVYIDGQEMTHLPPQRRNIGMVFQSYALFPNLTVYENIAFGLRLQKAANLHQKVCEMLELVDLIGKENAYPHELSGGQQQRVALARSLVVQPKVLLLDEPLSALDAKTRQKLQVEIKRIQQNLGITTIFVTHDQEEAMILSDTVHVMDNGQIIQSASPVELYTSPASIQVAKFIGNYNIFSTRVWKRLIPEARVTGQEMAIRPEVISLVEADLQIVDDRYWVVQGHIALAKMKGSMVRYEVQVKDTLWQVDLLHQKDALYPVGHPVQLVIPKDQCLYY